MEKEQSAYHPIENYGIIGNLKTTAMVSLTGSIDFMCFPEVDSATVFAKILDARKGGYFDIDPELPEYTSKQLYIPGTAVLLTRFFSEDGIAELTDYMPLDSSKGRAVNAIVRNLKAIRGNIVFRMTCAPRFGYAQTAHSAKLENNEIIFSTGDENQVQLKLVADVKLEIKEQDGYAEFTLKESETAHIVLEQYLPDSDQNTSIQYYLEHTYRETIKAWRDWIKKSTYKGKYSDLVYRSAITLKLLTSAEHGSVVAAATFGLPETIGGDRN